MIPARDEDDWGYHPSSFDAPNLRKGGCCFILLLLGLLVAARVVYVQIVDHRATVAAEVRCRQDRVLHVRQVAVWSDYLRQLPPTKPYDNFLIETGKIRKAMGIELKSFSSGDDHDLALVNADGEVARLSYVRASSIGFSIEGVPDQLFNCYGRSPKYYRYAYAF